MLEDALVDANFTRVDFVYEPGQYSVRGGIVDVFSFSESKPYRIDFFGDEVDSIRRFNISSQLSADKLDRVEIIPNLNAGDGAAKVSFVQFAGDAAAYWFYDADYVLRRVNDIRRRTLADMERPDEIDRLMTSRNALLGDLANCRMLALRDNLPERPGHGGRGIRHGSPAQVQQELRDAGRRYDPQFAARLHDLYPLGKQGAGRASRKHLSPDRRGRPSCGPFR